MISVSRLGLLVNPPPKSEDFTVWRCPDDCRLKRVLVGHWRRPAVLAAAALLDHSGQCPDILLVAGVYSVVHSGRTSLLQQVLYVVESLSSFLCDDDAAADDDILLPTGNQNM